MCGWGSQVEKLYAMLLEKSKEWKNQILKTHTVTPIRLSECGALCVISIDSRKPSVFFFVHKLEIIGPWINSMLKPAQIHLHPLLQFVNQRILGIPPPFSCAWPPPWLGLVSGCLEEPSRMPGPRSWRMSDRKYKVTTANLFKHWHFVQVYRRWTSVQHLIFLIPSTASAALQSSEGRILRPAPLPENDQNNHVKLLKPTWQTELDGKLCNCDINYLLCEI